FGGPTTPGDTVAGFPRSDPGTGLRSGDALPGGWCATTWDRAGDAPAALTGGHSHTGEEPLWSAQGGQRIIGVGIQTAEGGDDVIGVGAVVHARNPEGSGGLAQASALRAMRLKMRRGTNNCRPRITMTLRR